MTRDEVLRTSAPESLPSVRESHAKMASYPSVPTARNRPVRTCTECKQVKLRCDAKETFPRPCSRCVTRQLECVVDANFRRTPARQRLVDMTRELNSFRRSMNEGRDSTRESTEESSNSHKESTVSHGGSFCGSEDAFVDVQEAQIGDCFFSRDDVASIFETFSVLIYPHMPIIDPSMTVGSLQRSNPFLFWTIVVITIQRSPQMYTEHWPKLLEPYQTFLGKAVISSPITLLTLQAILYICAWPLPVEHQPRDPSWNLSGVAINAALHMGLHRPNHPPSLRAIGVYGDSPMRPITWLACFYVATRFVPAILCNLNSNGRFTTNELHSLSQTNGLLPPLRSPEDLACITKIISDPAIPRGFAAVADIQRCVANYTTVLSESTEASMISSIAQIFEQDLNMTKSRFSYCWSPRAEALLLVAKLYMYGTIAVNQLKQITAEPDNLVCNSTIFSHRVTLSQGLGVAIRLIQTLCNNLTAPESSSDSAPTAPPEQQTNTYNFPKFYMQGLIFAAMYLIRFFALGAWDIPDDRDRARNHVILVHTQMQHMSRNPMDEAGRAASCIETLSRGSGAAAPLTKGIASLRVSDRLGASILFDGISTASEIRNKSVFLQNDQENPQQSLSPETSPGQSYASGGSASGEQVGYIGEEAARVGGEWVWNTDFPQNVWEDIDMDMLGVAGELFSAGEGGMLG
ncbi:hypothetical protein BDY21DRAFT_33914 [Lineolata rhizophorae]|uniref:Zn(2)-C6 fungal-type domain-containing protein n=1 Tax=Lineolata rhizophorae TaxID=578093 RepID=A0A6A6NZG1_9PEZI|nr:hypothetical protein BDY21DRAFT_33914 [Lineolata rhizophorae]